MRKFYSLYQNVGSLVTRRRVLSSEDDRSDERTLTAGGSIAIHIHHTPTPMTDFAILPGYDRLFLDSSKDIDTSPRFKSKPSDLRPVIRNTKI